MKCHLLWEPCICSMIWTNSVEALQSLLKIAKIFLDYYCCYYVFNTVISIFITAHSLENVYPAIMLCKVRHRDWASAENEQLVPHYSARVMTRYFGGFFSLFFDMVVSCCCSMLLFGQFLLHAQFKGNSFPCISTITWQNIQPNIVKEILPLPLHADTKNHP